MRLNHERNKMKEQIKDNTDKIKNNKMLPYLVGNVVEVSRARLPARTPTCLRRTGVSCEETWRARWRDATHAAGSSGGRARRRRLRAEVEIAEGLGAFADLGRGGRFAPPRL